MSKPPNHALQQAAAAIVVSWGSTGQHAAAAAELGRYAGEYSWRSPGKMRSTRLRH